MVQRFWPAYWHPPLEVGIWQRFRPTDPTSSVKLGCAYDAAGAPSSLLMLQHTTDEGRRRNGSDQTPYRSHSHAQLPLTVALR